MAGGIARRGPSPGARSPAASELPALPRQRAVDAHAHARTPVATHPPLCARDTEGHRGRDWFSLLPMLPAYGRKNLAPFWGRNGSPGPRRRQGGSGVSADPVAHPRGPLTGEGLCLHHPSPSPCSDLVPNPDPAPCPLPASQRRTSCLQPRWMSLTLLCSPLQLATRWRSLSAFRGSPAHWGAGSCLPGLFSMGIYHGSDSEPWAAGMRL